MKVMHFRTGSVLRALAAAAIPVLLLTACGSSDSASTPSSTSSTTAKTRPNETPVGESLRGKRYCEVLLLQPATPGFVADVYNSFPMNDCPEAQWSALDAKAIAASNQVPIAVLNGPRYWLMDRIKKTPGAEVHQDFGGIDMIKRATVPIPDVAKAGTPYTPNHVNRETVFTFDRGQTVYELTAPDGATYAMQSWSQEIDPALVEAGLASLGARLRLPAGWTYSTRRLTKPLRVVTTKTSAEVVQDELKNSYSRAPTG
jgi:hypothetical protein